MNPVAVVYVVLLGLFVLTVLAVMVLGAWTLLRKMLDRRRSQGESEG